MCTKFTLNFFEHQTQARRRTALLVALFLIATLLIVALANMVVLSLGYYLYLLDTEAALSFSRWVVARPRIVSWTSLVTAGLVGGATLFRMASLAGGGAAVARASGAVLVDGSTLDPARQQLRNVVEEMAIAAGVPVPQVYLLENETGINAFAAGYSPADAAVVVTRGALEYLTRDELQGVIGHEFSHILNGDMRLNTRLLGLLFGIVVIGLAGRTILRAMVSRDSRGGPLHGGATVFGLFVAGAALAIIGYVGVVLGQLIKAAVSRQREMLADASAVQFTRNPAGIGGALKKIAAAPMRSVIVSVNAEELSHMLIADGRKPFEAMFSTHPPLTERIKLIDPHFDPSELARIRLVPVAQLAPVARVKPTDRAALDLLPHMVVATIGVPGVAALKTAAERHDSIPEDLLTAARSREDALAVVLALTLSRSADQQERQLALLRQRMPEAQCARVAALAAPVGRLDPLHRLPLLEVAFPALRQRTAAELRMLIVCVHDVARFDGRTDVFEYALGRLLRVYLSDVVTPRRAGRAALRSKLYALREEIGILFSVLAQSGHEDERAARAAHVAGVHRLLSSQAPEYAPPSTWSEALDRALARLDALRPHDKRELIEALVITVSHDHHLTLDEVELLRAICGSLHCPLPPPVPKVGTAVAANQ